MEFRTVKCDRNDINVTMTKFKPRGGAFAFEWFKLQARKNKKSEWQDVPVVVEDETY